jgi:hypothetical protein
MVCDQHLYRTACFHVVTREGLILNVAAESVEMATTWVSAPAILNITRSKVLKLSQVRGLVHVSAAAKPSAPPAAAGAKKEGQPQSKPHPPQPAVAAVSAVSSQTPAKKGDGAGGMLAFSLLCACIYKVFWVSGDAWMALSVTAENSSRCGASLKYRSRIDQVTFDV